jgi:hypothetical protein
MWEAPSLPLTLFRDALATERKLSILSTLASVSHAFEFRHGLFFDFGAARALPPGKSPAENDWELLEPFRRQRSWPLLSEHAYFLPFERGSVSYACPWRPACPKCLQQNIGPVILQFTRHPSAPSG